jgi:hypothetical protein
MKLNDKAPSTTYIFMTCPTLLLIETHSFSLQISFLNLIIFYIFIFIFIFLQCGLK